MTDFTPGTWVVVDGNTSGKEVICPSTTKNKRRIARMGGPDRDANANLIAAAPELYVELWNTVQCLTDIVEGRDWGAIEEYICSAQTALAKARGE